MAIDLNQEQCLPKESFCNSRDVKILPMQGYDSRHEGKRKSPQNEENKLLSTN